LINKVMRFTDLQEGPNDPGIFKAVFLAGGPGSGKSYVAKKLGLSSHGLKTVNSDDAFEYLMRKRDLSFDMPPDEQSQRDDARYYAKDIIKKRQDIYLDGRLGLIIDGTAKDPDKMLNLKSELEAIGYQTFMLFVNTSLRTALQRNLSRDRKVPVDIVTNSHKLVQSNKGKIADAFLPNYLEIQNDQNLDITDISKRIDKFINAPVSAKAKDWISKAHLQKTITQEAVSQNNLDELERYADKLFSTVGIDVNFTRHFLDRVNDQRNNKPISTAELIRLFRKEYQRWGKPIAQMGPDSEAVLKDMQTDINVPFVLKWDSRNNELDLVAKTVMRKSDFKSSNQVFPVESKIITEKFINLIGDRSLDQKNQYKQQVFDLLQSSYASIGGIKGSGFDSADDMVANIPFWKLAVKDGKLVAVLLYKDKQGRKSVAAGTDGSRVGKLTLQNMVSAESDRSYAEKSKAALSLAIKNMTPAEKSKYLIPVSQVKNITSDPVIPIKDLPESDWPITDPAEIESTKTSLERYPELWDYGYFREIGGQQKFKVMMGTPNKEIS
jgi:predicted kinase